MVARHMLGELAEQGQAESPRLRRSFALPEPVAHADTPTRPTPTRSPHPYVPEFLAGLTEKTCAVDGPIEEDKYGRIRNWNVLWIRRRHRPPICQRWNASGRYSP